MILYGEHRQFAMTRSLDGAVIQVHVGDFEIDAPGIVCRVSNDGESMVLRRDQHLPRVQVPYRMIPAAVAIRQS